MLLQRLKSRFAFVQPRFRAGKAGGRVGYHLLRSSLCKDLGVTRLGVRQLGFRLGKPRAGRVKLGSLRAPIAGGCLQSAAEHRLNGLVGNFVYQLAADSVLTDFIDNGLSLAVYCVDRIIRG